MDYETALRIAADLDFAGRDIAASLAAERAKCPLPQGRMNLTPEEAKTPAWRALKAESSRHFERVRAHNAMMARTFATELRAERRARDATRNAAAKA